MVAHELRSHRRVEQQLTVILNKMAETYRETGQICPRKEENKGLLTLINDLPRSLQIEAGRWSSKKPFPSRSHPAGWSTYATQRRKKRINLCFSSSKAASL